MIGFELQASGIGSNRFANWAATIAKTKEINFEQILELETFA